MTIDELSNVYTALPRRELAEKVTDESPNDDHVMYAPLGSFKRGFCNDINKSFRDRSFIVFELNRDGLYDILPKSLFHSFDLSPWEANNETDNDGLARVALEEKLARDFFLPFDSEIVSSSCEIAREDLKLSKSGLIFSDLFKLIEFYRLNEKFDYLTLLELLAVNMTGIETDKLFESSRDYTFPGIINKLAEICETRSPLIRLLEVLSGAGGKAGRKNRFAELLSYVLDAGITLDYKLLTETFIPQGPRYFDDNPDNGSILGYDFMLGDSVPLLSERLRINVHLKRCSLIKYYLEGRSFRKLLDAFCSYFLPYEVEYEVNVLSSEDNSFKLFPKDESSNDDFTDDQLIILTRTLKQANLNSELILNKSNISLLKGYLNSVNNSAEKDTSGFLGFNTVI